MRILSGQSNSDIVECLENKIVLRKEIGITFISESEEDSNKIKTFINEILSIK